MPIYAACFMVFTLANVGLPGTGGFVGEFLDHAGRLQVNTWVAIFAATGVILSAAYALYLYRRVDLRRAGQAGLQTIQDLTPREIAILAPLVVITILLGVYPKPVFDVTTPSVANLIRDIQDRAGASIMRRALARARHAGSRTMNLAADLLRPAARADPGGRRHGACCCWARSRGDKTRGWYPWLAVAAAGCRRWSCVVAARGRATSASTALSSPTASPASPRC